MVWLVKYRNDMEVIMIVSAVSSIKTKDKLGNLGDILGCFGPYLL